MSKAIKIGLVATVVLVFIFLGLPLQAERTEATFTGDHPNVSQRCGEIGDLNAFLSCSATSPQLRGLDLIHSVNHNMDVTTGGFGYLFLAALLVFLVLAFILV
jgi:hypothetical protein